MSFHMPKPRADAVRERLQSSDLIDDLLFYIGRPLAQNGSAAESPKIEQARVGPCLDVVRGSKREGLVDDNRIPPVEPARDVG